MWFDFGGTPDHVHCVYTASRFPLIDDMFMDEDPQTIEKLTIDGVTAPVCHMEHLPHFERSFRMLTGYLPATSIQDRVDVIVLRDYLGDNRLDAREVGEIIASGDNWVLDVAELTDLFVSHASASDLCRLIRNGNINPRHVYDLRERRFTIDEMSMFTGLQSFNLDACCELTSVANFADSLLKLYNSNKNFDIASLIGATRLEELHIASIKGKLIVQPFAESLRKLDVVRTTIDNNDLAQLHNLKELSLILCEYVTDLSNIPALENLTYLRLDRIDLPRDCIVNARNLTTLILMSVKISSISVMVTRLEKLTLIDCPFMTDESLVYIDYIENLELERVGISKFGRFAPTISSLIIDTCPNITDETLADVTGLVSLQLRNMPKITTVRPFMNTITNLLSCRSGLTFNPKHTPKLTRYNII